MMLGFCRPVLRAGGAILLLLPAAPAATALPMRPVLPLTLAQRMAAACVSLATREKFVIHVAVRDAGDDLVSYARMDGSPLGSQQGAMLKASTAANMGISSALLAGFAFDRKTGAPTAGAFIPGTAAMPGGLPIRAGGTLLGGIGVSGGRPEQDEACAKAGIDAIAADLNGG